MKVEMFLKDIHDEYAKEEFKPGNYKIPENDPRIWCAWKGGPWAHSNRKYKSDTNETSLRKILCLREEEFGGLVYNRKTAKVWKLDKDAFETLKEALAQIKDLSDKRKLNGSFKEIVASVTK